MEDRLLKEQTKATQDILKQVTDSFEFRGKYYTHFILSSNPALFAIQI